MKPLQLLTILLCTLLAGCSHQVRFNLNNLPDFKHLQKDHRIDSPPTHTQPHSAKQAIKDLPFRKLSRQTKGYFDHFLVANMPARQIAIQLRNLIHSPAFVDFDYADYKTLTAQQAYDQSQGNCLGYSHLYITLARHFGLKAHYQLIESDPTLVLRDQKISLSIHVNVVVKFADGTRFTADTVPTQQHLIKHGQLISDESADALHYNNLAINAMLEEDYFRSYQYLAKSLSLDSSLSLLWSNAGVIFRKNQQQAAAETSLRNALALNSHFYPALNNLAVLYHKQGDDIKSQYYLNKIRAFKARNPYHHYNLALLETHKKNYPAALKLIKKAIRLKDDEAEFYYQQSLLYELLNELDNSQQTLALAITHSNDRKRTLIFKKRQQRLISTKNSATNTE